MLQQRQSGNAHSKRNCKMWAGWKQELHFSTKKHKKQAKKQLRNGKFKELPPKGNFYRKYMNGEARWELVS